MGRPKIIDSNCRPAITSRSILVAVNNSWFTFPYQQFKVPVIDYIESLNTAPNDTWSSIPWGSTLVIEWGTNPNNEAVSASIVAGSFYVSASCSAVTTVAGGYQCFVASQVLTSPYGASCEEYSGYMVVGAQLINEAGVACTSVGAVPCGIVNLPCVLDFIPPESNLNGYAGSFAMLFCLAGELSNALLCPVAENPAQFLTYLIDDYFQNQPPVDGFVAPSGFPLTQTLDSGNLTLMCDPASGDPFGGAP